jgi:hypothetical protein
MNNCWHAFMLVSLAGTRNTAGRASERLQQTSFECMHGAVQSDGFLGEAEPVRMWHPYKRSAIRIPFYSLSLVTLTGLRSIALQLIHQVTSHSFSRTVTR